MRKVKSICKYLGYTLLYLIVCIGSAFGVITISMNNSAKQTTGSTETVVPKQISQIVDNLSNSENIATNLNVGLNSGESKIGIAVDAKINIGKNIDQISVDGNIVIDYDNTLYDIGITFKEGNLYFDVLGGKFRIETSNLIGSVSKIMELVGFEMPDLGGFDLENLNINELLGMLSDLTETKEKTQNILDIKVPMVDAMLKVVTDKKYNLQTLSLPLFSINNNTSLEMDGKFDYPESIVIDDKNNDDFVNLTTLIDVASDVLTLTKQNTLGIDALINYNGSSYGAFISADLENKKIMVETGYEGINAKLFFLDNSSIYLECGNIFAKFELKDINKVTSLLERLGIKLPIENIGDLINNVLKGNLDELKNSLNLESFDLSKLKLDFLEKIEVVDNTTTIKIKDIGEISITSLEEGIESIRFNGFGIDASLNFKQSKAIELKQEPSDYADLTLLIPVANNLIDFASNNAFSGNVMVSNGEFKIPVNFTFVNSDSLFVKASTSLYGKQIDLTFDQNTLYLDLLGNKVKFNLNDTDKILSEISTILGKDISLPEIDTTINEDTITKIIESVKDIINPEKIANLISLRENDGKLEIGVMGFEAIIETTPSSVKLNANYNGYSLTADIQATNDIVKDEIDETAYTDICNFVPVIENTLNMIKSREVNVEINGTYKDISVSGFANISNKTIELKLDASYNAINANIILKDNVLYVKAQNINIKLDLNDIDSPAKFVKDNFNIDIPYLDEIKSIINSQNKVDDIVSLITKNVTVTTPQVDTTNIDIEEILNNLTLEISDTLIKVVYGDLVNASVNFANDNISSIALTYGDITGSLTFSDVPYSIAVNDDYVDAMHLAKYVENTLNMIKSREVNIEINGTYKDISVSGFANISNKTIELKLDASYNAINANIILKDNVLYVKAQNINIKLDLNDIDSPAKFVKDNFNIDIPYLDEIKSIINSQNKVDDIISLITKNVTVTTPQIDTTNINIEEILNNLTLEISDTLIKVVYGDLVNASVNFANDNISSIALTYGDITGSLTFSNVPYSISVNDDYVDAMLLTRYVEQAMKIVDDGHIKAIAEILFPDSGEKVNAFVQADFSSQIKLGVELSSDNIEGLDISFFVEEGILYFNYNGLLLKIDNKAFGEILSIALEFLGIDPSTIPFLEKIDLDFNLNEELGISTGVDLDPMKALNYIDYISGMGVNGNDIVISLNGKLLYGNDDAEDITITFTSTGERLTGIKLGNVYNSNRTRQIDASFTIQEWTGYTGVDKTKNYIDISCASDLIKGLVNMVTTKDFHIAGTFNVNGKMAGIDLASAVKALGKNNVIPFDIKIKVVDKKPEIAIVLGEIPAVVGVNNDVPYEFGDTESGDNRFLYIYYKDDAIYIYRSETVDIMFGAGKRSYEKATKISLDRLLEDPMYYVQYSLGFTDDIINAMKDSMQLASNRTTPMDYSNILRPIEVVDSNSYRVKINMAEVSNNPQLGIMSILFRIGQDRNGKNYVDHLEFGLDLPLKEDTVNLQLDSSNIDVKNYLDEVDMSALYDYVNKYAYNFDEEWEASKGKWSKSSEKIYTIKFNSNGGQSVGDITGCYKTPVSLPTLPDIVTDNGAYKSTKVFAGWFTDQNFAEETRSSLTTMPRHDTTLYAKWDETIVYYRTIKFVTNSKFTCDDITKLSGSEITLFILEDKEETQGNTTSYYHFVGWYTDESLSEESAFNESIMPDYDVTLYAKWELYKEETTANFKLYHNDDLLIDKQVKVGDKVDITNALVKEDTKFYYNKDFSGEIYEGNFEIIEDTTLYLRNKYHFTITSDHGTKINSEFDLYEGEAILNIPSQETYVEDDGKTNVTYTFKGYNETLTIAPDRDVDIIANWEIETKHYYTINFNIDLYNCTALPNASWKNGAPTAIQSQTLLEGTTINLKESKYQVSAIAWATKVHGRLGVSYNLKSTSWGTSKWGYSTSGGDGFTSYTVTGNATLYACWEIV